MTNRLKQAELEKRKLTELTGNIPTLERPIERNALDKLGTTVERCDPVDDKKERSPAALALKHGRDITRADVEEEGQNNQQKIGT